MSLLKKYKEIILYLIFGVLTTLVNFVIFILFSRLLGDSFYLLSNLVAWIGAVIFAFVVNKLLVFGSRSTERAALLREIAEFVGARIFSFLIEEAGLFLLVDALGMGELSWTVLTVTVSGQLIAKAVLAVIVVILNYFFSKFVIFKKR